MRRTWGVNFDCELSFDAHIQRVVKKANQMIGIHVDREAFF